MIGDAVQQIVTRVEAGVGPDLGQRRKAEIVGNRKGREAEQRMGAERNRDRPKGHPVPCRTAHHAVFPIPPSRPGPGLATYFAKGKAARP